MRYFAEIGPGNVVQRVIVADSLEWCVEFVQPSTGWWVETYQGHPTERYAGVGMVLVESDPRKFLYQSEV